MQVKQSLKVITVLKFILVPAVAGVSSGDAFAGIRKFQILTQGINPVMYGEWVDHKLHWLNHYNEGTLPKDAPCWIVDSGTSLLSTPSGNVEFYKYESSQCIIDDSELAPEYRNPENEAAIAKAADEAAQNSRDPRRAAHAARNRYYRKFLRYKYDTVEFIKEELGNNEASTIKKEMIPSSAIWQKLNSLPGESRWQCIIHDSEMAPEYQSEEYKASIGYGARTAAAKSNQHPKSTQLITDQTAEAF